MDMNEQKSVFLASNQNNLRLANEYTQKKLDKALKRNLEKQIRKIEEKSVGEKPLNQEITE